MAYCTTNYCEETPVSRIMREKDREIKILKDVIVEQAKELIEAKTSYLEIIDRNTELRDERDLLRRESNDMYAKTCKIKDLLRLAKECADDTTKSEHQRDVSKIRVETLNDVLDILEGKDEEGKNE